MAQVEIVLGSDTDYAAVEQSKMLDIFQAVGVNWVLSIISTHRHPDELREYCLKTVAQEKTLVFIGIAGMAAALPGAITADIGARRPVIGVALPSSDCPTAIDALLSMVRMPPGRPVAVTGIGSAGLKNAALLACQIVAESDPEVEQALHNYLQQSNKTVQVNYRSSETYQKGEWS